MVITLKKLQDHIASYGQDQSPEIIRVLIKEFLQSYILSAIYNHKEYGRLAFYGGTCARIIYGLDRLSEDIDLHNADAITLDKFADFLQDSMTSFFQLQDISVHTQTGKNAGIYRFTVKFPVLHVLGLSPLPSEKLHVKVEASANTQDTQMIYTHKLLQGQSMTIRHFTKESLMAGKMVACIERVFRRGATDIQIKGRDFYDLWWYMQSGTRPYEPRLLHNTTQSYTPEEAFSLLEKKVNEIKASDILPDLQSFILNRNYLENWLEIYHDQMQKLFGEYREMYT